MEIERLELTEMQQSKEVHSYLVRKYEQLGLGSSSTCGSDEWDPYVYPDTGYIPYCPTCQQQLADAKTLVKSTGSGDVDTIKIEMNHWIGCLWFDWFVPKIKALHPKIVVIRKSQQSAAKK